MFPGALAAILGQQRRAEQNADSNRNSAVPLKKLRDKHIFIEEDTDGMILTITWEKGTKASRIRLDHDDSIVNWGTVLSNMGTNIAGSEA